MWRGSAVEHGVDRVLRGQSEAEATQAALGLFETNAQGDLSDDVEAERKLIQPMIQQAGEWASERKLKGTIAATQLKVEARLEGVSVPVIGYLDFTFLEGADVDLKTTKACPSAPRPDHLRQVALYWRDRKRPAGLLYVTAKKRAYYEPAESELARAVAELSSAGRALERFLSFIPDAQTAIQSMPHDIDHYAYGSASKARLLEIQEQF
jgi:hypothetical protein